MTLYSVNCARPGVKRGIDCSARQLRSVLTQNSTNSAFAWEDFRMATCLKLSDTTREIRLSVRSRCLSLTKAYRSAVLRTLATTLGRFARRIRAIQVWIEDVNGPRGGVDTRCRIDVDLRPRGRISMSALATDEYAATAKAAARSRELVDRRVKRSRALRRQIVRAQ
jgi:hypothetical protein